MKLRILNHTLVVYLGLCLCLQAPEKTQSILVLAGHWNHCSVLVNDLGRNFIHYASVSSIGQICFGSCYQDADSCFCFGVPRFVANETSSLSTALIGPIL